MKNTYKEIHIQSVRIGDTVLCSDGRERTVCPKDFKANREIGITLFGDSYQLGQKMVTIVDYSHTRKANEDAIQNNLKKLADKNQKQR